MCEEVAVMGARRSVVEVRFGGVGRECEMAWLGNHLGKFRIFSRLHFVLGACYLESRVLL
jgi:hypothetical protein